MKQQIAKLKKKETPVRAGERPNPPKRTIIIHFLLTVLILALFTTDRACAETFYQCTDKEGRETLLNSPLEGQTCTPISLPKTTPPAGSQANPEPLAAPKQNITKINIRGNQVFIPVTLVHKGVEAEAYFLIDTGATATAIHKETAERLNISFHQAQKARGEIVGGTFIEAAVTTIDYLKIGHFTIRDKQIYIIPYEGESAKFDGMLGVDVLKIFSYKIDFARQVIIWD